MQLEIASLLVTGPRVEGSGEILPPSSSSPHNTLSLSLSLSTDHRASGCEVDTNTAGAGAREWRKVSQQYCLSLATSTAVLQLCSGAAGSNHTATH